MKRVVYIAPFPILPLDTGTRIRIYQTVTFLARHFEVHVVILSEKEPAAAAWPVNGCKEIRHIPTAPMKLKGIDRAAALVGKMVSARPCSYNKKIWKHLQELIAGLAPDVVIAWGTMTAQFLNLHSKLKGIRYIFDEAGTDHLRIKSAMAFTPRRLDRMVMAMRCLRLLWYERSFCSRVDHLLAVSQDEAGYLTGPMHHPSVHVIPCGANSDLFDYSYAGDDNSTILFCGDLTYPPNEDAARYALQIVIPLLLAENERFEFLIVGRTGGSAIEELARPLRQVNVVGYVKDMNVYWRKASIFLNPVRTGRGFMTKILDAFSAGMAVVSTSTFLQKSDIVPNIHYLPGDTAPALAEGINRLLNEPALKKQLSLNGREYAASHGWNAALEPLRRLIEGE
ncbi:MAG: glycosyltransferase [Chitinispirillaceae bacterium]|nr:glycosyltransferase [Chitinispirillaceae bacterium]